MDLIQRLPLTNLQKEILNALLESGVKYDSFKQIFKTSDHSKTKSTQTDNNDHDHNAIENIPTSPKDDVINSSTGTSTEQELSETSPTVCNHDESSHLELEDDDDRDDKEILENMIRTSPWIVSKYILAYMHKHNVPQKEAVATTGLNQSHLSQHLNKGTPMRESKRKELYAWFLNKKREVAETYKEYGSKRPIENPIEDNDEPYRKKENRSRFKWGTSSNSLLFAAYKEQPNPAKYERNVLAARCNRIELEFRGLDPTKIAALGGNIVTEMRVYNWYANRRKEEMFRIRNESIVEDSTKAMIELTANEAREISKSKTLIVPKLPISTSSSPYDNTLKVYVINDETIQKEAVQTIPCQLSCNTIIASEVSSTNSVCSTTIQSNHLPLNTLGESQSHLISSSSHNSIFHPSPFVSIPTPWMLCSSSIVPSAPTQLIPVQSNLPCSSILVPITQVPMSLPNDYEEGKPNSGIETSNIMHGIAGTMPVSMANENGFKGKVPIIIQQHPSITLPNASKSNELTSLLPDVHLSESVAQILSPFEPSSNPSNIHTSLTYSIAVPDHQLMATSVNQPIDQSGSTDVLGLCWSQIDASVYSQTNGLPH